MYSIDSKDATPTALCSKRENNVLQRWHAYSVYTITWTRTESDLMVNHIINNYKKVS